MSNDSNAWPFEDPKKQVVFSIRQIVFGTEPILSVTHDGDDGSWQFLGEDTPSTSDAAVIGLEEICDLDPSIKELANLPIGWEARRSYENAEGESKKSET